MQRRIPVVMMSLTLCLGCAGVEVSRDVDDDYDFSKLHAWNFLEVTPVQAGVDSVTLERIHDAIAEELTAKGFERSGTPDFGISVRGERKTQTDIDGYGYDWSQRDSTNLHAFQYDEGTLTIDIVDIDTQKMVWSSTGTAVIGSVDPVSARNRVQAAVHKMLSSFPPTRH